MDHHRDGEEDGRLFGEARRSAVMIMGEGAAAARDVPGCIVTVSAETPGQAAAAAARQGMASSVRISV